MDKKALLLCLVQYAEGFNKDKGEHELVFRLYLKMYKHIAISKHVHFCIYVCKCYLVYFEKKNIP